MPAACGPSLCDARRLRAELVAEQEVAGDDHAHDRDQADQQCGQGLFHWPLAEIAGKKDQRQGQRDGNGGECILQRIQFGGSPFKREYEEVGRDDAEEIEDEDRADLSDGTEAAAKQHDTCRNQQVDRQGEDGQKRMHRQGLF